MESTGTRYLVDEYGTVISEIKSDEFCQIKSHKSVNKWKESMQVNFYFHKVNMPAFRYCCRKYSIFLDLVDYISYSDNALTFSNGKPLKTTNLKGIVTVGYKSVQNQLRDMCKEDVLRKMELGNITYYVMNPWVVMRGGRIITLVYEAFSQSRWRKDAKEMDDK